MTPNADNNSCSLPGQYNKQAFIIIYILFRNSRFLFRFSYRFLIIHFTRRRLQFGQSKARTLQFLIFLARDRLSFITTEKQ